MIHQLIVLVLLISSLHSQKLVIEVPRFEEDFDNFISVAGVIPPVEVATVSIDAIRNSFYLKTEFEWREIEFIFPNATDQQNAIDDQSYIKGNTVPMDVDVEYSTTRGLPRIFITTPRIQIGIPITLGTIARNVKASNGGPKIRPYPNYAWHTNPEECIGMASVYRIAIDMCNRMWVLDTGRIANVQVCPRQLLLFDLKTDTLLHRHVFEPSVLRAHSLLVNLILDIRDAKCEDTFIYIADVTSFALIIYDYSKDFAYRVQNKLFFPYPSSGTHTIAGEQFDLMDGLLGMALGPLVDDDRYLYFHSLASVTENRVACSQIRNSTEYEISPQALPHQFWVYRGHRGSQSALSAIDSRGIMYLGLNEDTSLACWHTTDPYGEPHIQTLIRDKTALQFVSGMKIIKNTRKFDTEEIWVLTNRIQKFFTGTMNNNTINFRVFVGDVKTLTLGSPCEKFRRIQKVTETDTDNFFEPLSSPHEQKNFNS